MPGPTLGQDARGEAEPPRKGAVTERAHQAPPYRPSLGALSSLHKVFLLDNAVCAQTHPPNQIGHDGNATLPHT